MNGAIVKYTNGNQIVVFTPKQTMSSTSKITSTIAAYKKSLAE